MAANRAEALPLADDGVSRASRVCHTGRYIPARKKKAAMKPQNQAMLGASGKASALFAAIFALLGSGVAPVFVGVMADELFEGQKALGEALAAWSVITVAISCLAAIFLTLRLRTYREVA